MREMPGLSMSHPVTWIAVIAAAGLLVVAALAFALGRAGENRAAEQLGSAGPYRGSEAPGRIALPDFALADSTGKVVRSRRLRGRVVLLTFLDSQCTESCPLIASQVARTLDALTPRERSQIVPIAISTDPAEDSRRSVRVFLRRNRAVGRLHYLGGGEPVARMRALWKRFHILSSLESGQDTLHSAPVRIYDRSGVWVATLHAGADLTRANLAHDLRLALLS